MEFAGKAKIPGLKLKATTGSVRQQTSCCQWANSSLCIAILTTVNREDKNVLFRAILCQTEGGQMRLKAVALGIFDPLGSPTYQFAWPNRTWDISASLSQILTRLPAVLSLTDGFPSASVKNRVTMSGIFVSNLWRYNTSLSHQYTQLLIR